MRKKRSFVNIILVSIITFAFTSNQLAVGMTASEHNITPPWITSEAPTQEAEDFQNKVVSDWATMHVLLAIADYFFKPEDKPKALKDFLSKEFMGVVDYLDETYIDLNDVEFTGIEVLLPFRKNYKSRLARIALNEKSKDMQYVVSIEQNNTLDNKLLTIAERFRKKRNSEGISLHRAYEKIIYEILLRLEADPDELSNDPDEALVEVLKNGGVRRILEVGCGDCAFLAGFAGIAEKAEIEIIGIDRDPTPGNGKVKRILDEKLIRTLKGDIQDLSDKEGFDIIVSAGVMSFYGSYQAKESGLDSKGLREAIENAHGAAKRGVELLSEHPKAALFTNTFNTFLLLKNEKVEEFSDIVLWDEDEVGDISDIYKSVRDHLGKKILESVWKQAAKLAVLAKKNKKSTISEKKHLETNPKGMQNMSRSNKSLPEQIFVPDQDEDPSGFAVSKASKLVLEGRLIEASELLFTSSALQKQGSALSVLAEVSNTLLDVASKESSSVSALKYFLKDVISNAVEYSMDPGTSQSMQLLAGQALTIISWMERNIPGSEKIRVTANLDKMAANEKRGMSFIDRTTLPVKEVSREGSRGFYFRGTEKITTKLKGDNTSKRLMFSSERVDVTRDNVVMYLMDHGFIEVPEGIKSLTDNGTISTMHETFFLNNLVPGSFQSTSTGAGHFQGLKLDVKHITEGGVLQANVKYNAQGEIEEVIVQHLTEGDWALALPGYVDYMINCGGARFNDFSIELDPEEAMKFNPGFDFSSENLAKVEKAISEKGTVAPYLGAGVNAGMRFMKNTESAPNIRWMGPNVIASAQLSLIEVYQKLDEESLDDFKEVLASTFEIASVAYVRTLEVQPLQKVELEISKKPAAPTFGKTQEIISYTDKTVLLAARMFAEEAAEDVLVRVSVETIESINSKSVIDYINEIQKTPHGFIKLIDPETAKEASLEVYGKLGIERKDLPADFSKSRKNTITLLPVLKGDKLSSKALSIGGSNMVDVGGLTDSIISPVGINFDKAGFIRSMFFGLGLLEIARGHTERAQELLDDYRTFAESQGVENFSFDINDIISLATGNINQVVMALNRLIRSLPIMPVNEEELRTIYENARAALIKA